MGEKGFLYATPFQTGPGAGTASYTKGTGALFLG